MLVELEIGNEALQPIVLVLKPPEAAHLARPEMGELLLPDIERRLAHARLSADVRDGGAALRLAQDIGDLFFAKTRLLHRAVLHVWPRAQTYSTSRLPSNSRTTSLDFTAAQSHDASVVDDVSKAT